MAVTAFTKVLYYYCCKPVAQPDNNREEQIAVITVDRTFVFTVDCIVDGASS